MAADFQKQQFRRIELAFENKRWTDLLENGRAVKS